MSRSETAAVCCGALIVSRSMLNCSIVLHSALNIVKLKCSNLCVTLNMDRICKKGSMFPQKPHQTIFRLY